MSFDDDNADDEDDNNDADDVEGLADNEQGVAFIEAEDKSCKTIRSTVSTGSEISEVSPEVRWWWWLARQALGFKTPFIWACGGGGRLCAEVDEVAAVVAVADDCTIGCLGRGEVLL